VRLLFLSVPIPNGHKKALVKVGREKFKGELLIEPRIVVAFNESRAARRLLPFVSGD